MGFLGIDTSNYTTSTAFYDGKEIFQEKRLLPVKDGEKGLRQSDAVFHHTKVYPELLKKLFEKNGNDIEAIGVSVKPTTQEGSYMPCFLVGESVASSLGDALGVKVFCFSHQQGHIAAALYSADKTDLLKDNFLAFHVSGGTTDLVFCEPCKETVFKTTPVVSSSDLKAGQAVDRLGVKMGFSFPAGVKIEELANRSANDYKNKIKLVNGCCSLSGIQNKCERMLSDGETPENTAKFLLCYIADTVIAMTNYALSVYENIPVIYAGGVMSNKIIQQRIRDALSNVYFAEPQFSCDNAGGVAYLASIMSGEK